MAQMQNDLESFIRERLPMYNDYLPFYGCLDEDERLVLRGYKYAIEDLEHAIESLAFDASVDYAATEILSKIAEDLVNATGKKLVRRLEYDMGALYTAFVDNHPDNEGEE